MYLILEGLHTIMARFGASDEFHRLSDRSLALSLGQANIEYVLLWTDYESRSPSMLTALQGRDRTNPHLKSSDVNAKHVLQVLMLG